MKVNPIYKGYKRDTNGSKSQSNYSTVLGCACDSDSRLGTNADTIILILTLIAMRCQLVVYV